MRICSVSGLWWRDTSCWCFERLLETVTRALKYYVKSLPNIIKLCISSWRFFILLIYAIVDTCDLSSPTGLWKSIFCPVGLWPWCVGFLLVSTSFCTFQAVSSGSLPFRFVCAGIRKICDCCWRGFYHPQSIRLYFDNCIGSLDYNGAINCMCWECLWNVSV